jgi:aminopeptidase N
MHPSRLVIAALVLLSALAVQAARLEPLIKTWKPIHYEVSLSFNPQLTEISSARTEITLKVLADRLTELDFDFGEMPIDSITIGGKPTPRIERSGDRVSVLLNEPAAKGDTLRITFNYHGRPKDGLIFDTDRDGNPSATGDNWPDRVHHWIPCLDHPSAKATVTFTITAPPQEIVVANGRLVSMTRNGDESSVWIFKEGNPIPPYCMVVAVSEGAKIDAVENSVTPLSFYVPNKDSAYASKGFSSADEALEFFSETVAPYPYEKLALIVGATRFGGMENSSAIVFTNNLFDLRGNEKISTRFGIPTRIESLVAHEIAHQWFGDSVTEATWSDLWLSEGFATYFAGLFIEKQEGDAAFREYMRDAAQRYFAYEKQRNAPIYDDLSQVTKLLNENNYEKGAWVLHMLRRRLGDEAFFRGLRNYYNKHREANATTEDLRSALEDSSGKDLRGFFGRWIYEAGHPIYEVNSRPIFARGKQRFFSITIRQTQTGQVFTDPITVRITSGDYSELTTIEPRTRIVSVPFHHPQRPTSIEIDPNDTILKEVVQK